jgi:hypothetical protein
MISRAQIRDSRLIEVGWRFLQCSRQLQSLLLPLGCSLWLPGVLSDEVDDVRDDS